MKVSDSLVNVPNELSQLGTNRQTNRLSDQLLELLEWLFATENKFMSFFRMEILHWMDLYDRRNEMILEAK